MIPILYEASETAFTTNGLGRLRDAISCRVVEERNSVYELDMEYPVDGAHYDLITPGRIIYATHDESETPEPFDIVSISRPISGVIEVHAVHISYRLTGITCFGSNINTLQDAFTMFAGAEPENPFSFTTDITTSAYMASADGTPRSVREFMGGVEGSVLDTWGGEYTFSGFTVKLEKSRGVLRGFAIRYGVNMTEYQEDTDYSNTYTSCMPYWTGTDENGAPVMVKGNRVDLGGTSYNGRNICIPLDLTDKYETEPTSAELEAGALSYMKANNAELPAQTIEVNFARLQDLGFSEYDQLLTCNLCDTITVIYPYGNATGQYKIVRTEWDVLQDRYSEMTLGTLRTSLSEALGITNTLDQTASGGGSTSEAIPGVIEMYAGSVAPSGWLLCNGAEVLKADYPKLAPIVGNTYGTPSDNDHFVLPDLRGRVAVGVGNGTATGHTDHTLGQKAGNENAIIPYHRHTFGSGTTFSFMGIHLQSGRAGKLTLGTSGSNRYAYASNTSYDDLSNSQYVAYAGTSGNTTGANMQPYLAVNYIICTGE